MEALKYKNVHLTEGLFKENASIPMAHGSAKMYEVTGDEKWLKITKEFWKQAIHDREAFATGGQNAGEFWIAPKLFSNIYFHDPATNKISVEQYIGSEMNLDGIKICQETNMNYCQGSLFDDSRNNDIKTRWSFTFYITSKDEITVQFRIPGWAYCVSCC